MPNFISWTDLRSTCIECKKRADFNVEYSNKDLPENYLRDGTRIHGYCLEHLPEEIKISRQQLIMEAQKPVRI